MVQNLQKNKLFIKNNIKYYNLKLKQMAVSKNRKNHKNKVANRNLAIKQQKAKVEKTQRDFIMNLIDEEKKKGLFNDDTVTGPSISETGPLTGPAIGNISFNGDLLTLNKDSDEIQPTT